MIRLKRVYETPGEDDGFRVLVERLWPRGLSKQRARVDLWLKGVAPSPELRKWYGHETGKWETFRRRYREELRHNDAVAQMRDLLRDHARVTFVFAARDPDYNSARLLQEFLEQYP